MSSVPLQRTFLLSVHSSAPARDGYEKIAVFGGGHKCFLDLFVPTDRKCLIFLSISFIILLVVI